MNDESFYDFKFTLHLKNQFYFLMVPEKYQKYFSQLKAMHLMACILLFIYSFFLVADLMQNWMELVGLFPATLATLWIVLRKGNLLKQVEVNQVLRLFEIGFLGIAASYFYYQQMWLGAFLYGILSLFLLLLLVVEYQVFSQRFIELNENEIIYPQLFFKRRINWSQVKNVVIKFDVLTLELSNNTFIQQGVFHKYDDIELQLFDDFLKRQIQ